VLVGSAPPGIAWSSLGSPHNGQTALRLYQQRLGLLCSE